MRGRSASLVTFFFVVACCAEPGPGPIVCIDANKDRTQATGLIQRSMQDLPFLNEAMGAHFGLPNQRNRHPRENSDQGRHALCKLHILCTYAKEPAWEGSNAGS